MFTAGRILWIVLAIVGACLPCATPLAGLAAAAALHLRKSYAYVLVLLALGLNQVIDFTCRGYPVNAISIGWGLVLAASGITAVFVANHLRGWTAFLASFVAYEGVLIVASIWLGERSAFTPSIVLQVFAVNAGWFALGHWGSKALDRIQVQATLT